MQTSQLKNVTNVLYLMNLVYIYMKSIQIYNLI